MSRIISYGEKTEYNDGDYLLLDNGKGGTKRIRADRVGIQLDPTLTDPNKAAPANAVKPVDAVPAQGSSNAVSSGGVWDALHNTDTTLSQSVGAYPVDTATGAIASFSDGADNIPMKKVTVRIEPKQAGTGDPSPDNVRPISGWTGAQVARTGVNVWDEEWELGWYRLGVKIPATDTICSKNKIPVSPGKKYYVLTPTPFYYTYYDINGDFLPMSEYDKNGRYATSVSVEITIPANAYYMTFNLGTAYGATYNHDISINYPSTDTSYHPYTGNTYPITFPSEAGTVYGGTLDVTNGVLTVDRGYYVVTNATEITNDGSYTDFNRVNIADGTGKLSGKPNGGIISNVFKLGLLDVNSVFMHGTTGVINFTPSISIGTTLSEIKAWLIANNAEFCYELAEPITYTLTPTEIKSLLGDNNIWADAGDTTAVYMADTTLYINRKIAEAVSALS